MILSIRRNISYKIYHAMPYKIVPEGSGFIVKHGTHAFSKKPITKEMATKQRIAIALSEAKKTQKPVSKFFK
jgi:hypothetical protein